MKVSEILILAADNHLATGRTDDGKTPSSGNSPYICDAVSACGWDEPGIDRFKADDAIEFLHTLGMGSGYGVWDHIPASRRQKARFDFLNLAALLADDLGINT